MDAQLLEGLLYWRIRRGLLGWRWEQCRVCLDARELQAFRSAKTRSERLVDRVQLTNVVLLAQAVLLPPCAPVDIAGVCYQAPDGVTAPAGIRIAQKARQDVLLCAESIRQRDVWLRALRAALSGPCQPRMSSLGAKGHMLPIDGTLQQMTTPHDNMVGDCVKSGSDSIDHAGDGSLDDQRAQNHSHHSCESPIEKQGPSPSTGKDGQGGKGPAHPGIKTGGKSGKGPPPHHAKGAKGPPLPGDQSVKGPPSAQAKGSGKKCPPLPKGKGTQDLARTGEKGAAGPSVIGSKGADDDSADLKQQDGHVEGEIDSQEQNTGSIISERPGDDEDGNDGTRRLCRRNSRRRTWFDLVGSRSVEATQQNIFTVTAQMEFPPTDFQSWVETDLGGGATPSSGGRRRSRTEEVQLFGRDESFVLGVKTATIKTDLVAAAASAMTLVGIDDIATLDNVETLCFEMAKLVGDRDPLQQVREYLGRGRDIDKLRDVERRLVPLARVRRVLPRLRLLAGAGKLQAQVEKMRHEVEIIRSTAADVRTSVHLQGIIRIVLDFMEWTEGGEGGRALLAFSLTEQLEKLDRIKPPSSARAKAIPGYTLLHEVARTLLSWGRVLNPDPFTSEMPHLHTAAKTSIQRVRDELKHLRDLGHVAMDEIRNHKDEYVQGDLLVEDMRPPQDVVDSASAPASGLSLVARMRARLALVTTRTSANASNSASEVGGDAPQNSEGAADAVSVEGAADGVSVSGPEEFALDAQDDGRRSCFGCIDEPRESSLELRSVPSAADAAAVLVYQLQWRRRGTFDRVAPRCIVAPVGFEGLSRASSLGAGQEQGRRGSIFNRQGFVWVLSPQREGRRMKWWKCRADVRAHHLVLRRWHRRRPGREAAVPLLGADVLLLKAIAASDLSQWLASLQVLGVELRVAGSSHPLVIRVDSKACMERWAAALEEESSRCGAGRLLLARGGTWKPHWCFLDLEQSRLQCYASSVDAVFDERADYVVNLGSCAVMVDDDRDRNMAGYSVQPPCEKGRTTIRNLLICAVDDVNPTSEQQACSSMDPGSHEPLQASPQEFFDGACVYPFTIEELQASERWAGDRRVTRLATATHSERNSWLDVLTDPRRTLRWRHNLDKGDGAACPALRPSFGPDPAQVRCPQDDRAALARSGGEKSPWEEQPECRPSFGLQYDKASVAALDDAEGADLSNSASLLTDDDEEDSGPPLLPAPPPEARLSMMPSRLSISSKSDPSSVDHPSDMNDQSDSDGPELPGNREVLEDDPAEDDPEALANLRSLSRRLRSEASSLASELEEAECSAREALDFIGEVIESDALDTFHQFLEKLSGFSKKFNIAAQTMISVQEKKRRSRRGPADEGRLSESCCLRDARVAADRSQGACGSG